MRLLLGLAAFLLSAAACGKSSSPPPAPADPAAQAPTKPAAEKAMPKLHPNNIVSIAVNSPDHETLVAALKAADYVTAVSNPGPLTVFAPTDAAFDALPPEAVAELMRPEKQADLKNVLKYHATTSSYMPKDLRDGQTLAMANGAKTTIRFEGETLMINDAKVVASVRAENGVVHVIDKVLLPPAP